MVIDVHGRVYLTDFGLSTFVNAEGKATGAVGSHDFAPPDVYYNRDYGPYDCRLLVCRCHHFRFVDT